VTAGKTNSGKNGKQILRRAAHGITMTAGRGRDDPHFRIVTSEPMPYLGTLVHTLAPLKEIS
jgi:hypothetical protein